jgi:hypothetical protein
MYWVRAVQTVAGIVGLLEGKFKRLEKENAVHRLR